MDSLKKRIFDRYSDMLPIESDNDGDFSWVQNQAITEISQYR